MNCTLWIMLIGCNVDLWHPKYVEMEDLFSKEAKDCWDQFCAIFFFYNTFDLLPASIVYLNSQVSSH